MSILNVVNFLTRWKSAQEFDASAHVGVYRHQVSSHGQHANGCQHYGRHRLLKVFTNLKRVREDDMQMIMQVKTFNLRPLAASCLHLLSLHGGGVLDPILPPNPLVVPAGSRKHETRLSGPLCLPRACPVSVIACL